jgi:hypothetical protein
LSDPSRSRTDFWVIPSFETQRSYTAPTKASAEGPVQVKSHASFIFV